MSPISFLDAVFPASFFALILISGWCFPLLFPRIASMVASCSLICLSLSRCASRGLPQFQAEVPDPLREDLAKLLAARHMGVPAIRILLRVFISKHHLKRSPVQVEVEDIRVGKRRRWKGADKELVDGTVTLNADFRGRGGGDMGSHHQVHLGSGWCQGNGWAIVECARYPAFWMGTHLIRCMRKCLLDHLQIQETVVTTSGNHAKTSGEHIDEGSCVAIESVETKQHGSSGKGKLCGIASDHRDGPQQFPAVISIAWSSKRAEKLMRMRLEQDRTGTHHFSPFAPLIARRADLIETAMGRGQRLQLRQRPLAGGLSGPVHIDDHPLFFRPVEQATGGSKWVPGVQILLKARAQSFYGALIEGGEKAGEGRAIGQLVSVKQGHERLGKRQQPFVKGQERGFARNGITDQDGDKIDEVVVTKARAGETHLILDRFQDSRMGENLSKDRRFSHPGRS